jgi:hypothetical protein
LDFSLELEHRFSPRQAKLFKAQIVIIALSWKCRDGDSDSIVLEKLDSAWGGKNPILDLIEVNRGAFGSCDICSADATVTGLMYSVKDEKPPGQEFTKPVEFMDPNTGEPSNNRPIPNLAEYYRGWTDELIYSWVVLYSYREIEKGKVTQDDVTGIHTTGGIIR